MSQTVFNRVSVNNENYLADLVALARRWCVAADLISYKRSQIRISSITDVLNIQLSQKIIQVVLDDEDNLNSKHSTKQIDSY